MLVQIKDYLSNWRETTLDKLLQHIGSMEPLLVSTQPEFDFLMSMQLMIGRSFILLMDEKLNPTDLPPSYVKIEIPL